MPGSGKLNPLTSAANARAASITSGRGSQYGVPDTGVNIPQQNAAATAAGVRGRGSGVGITANANVPTDPTVAPPKADAAPKPNAQTTIAGLMDALNNFQLELVKNGTVTVPDVYEIAFVPSSLASAKIIKQGTTDKSTVSMSTGSSASDQLDPEKQSVNYSSRSWKINAGTQIVQFIDQVMRNSSYIEDQANAIIVESDQETVTKKPDGNIAWYKIGVYAEPLKFDPKRNDTAYKIKFVVSAYGINRMESEYFPNGTFRGVHKNYNYWFTGLNTQVLHFEQDYNYLYQIALSNPSLAVTTQQETDSREIISRVYMGTNNQSVQGAKGRTNDPGASGADYLYSPTDQATVKLRIIGDPAWLMQGEAATGIKPETFSFAPFLPDGTINFDAAQILFTMNWNRAQDYDLSTGLMDPNSGNKNGAPRESATYIAKTCKSYFKQGKFEQELEGKLFRVPIPSTATSSQQRDVPATQGEERPGGSAAAIANKPVTGGGQSSPQFAASDPRRTDAPPPPPPSDKIKLLPATPASNEVSNNRISITEAQNILSNGSERDIQAFGGRAYLEGIINRNAIGVKPTEQNDWGSSQRITKDKNPG